MKRETAMRTDKELVVVTGGATAEVLAMLERGAS
jgi:hypothetical protein